MNISVDGLKDGERSDQLSGSRQRLWLQSFRNQLLKFTNQSEIGILWFEDMKKDLVSVIKDVASFAGYHITQYKTLVLDDHLYIDNFRQLMVDAMGGDPGMKKFIRKGQVGDWKNYFNEENSKIWDKWIADNLSGTDIVLPDH